MQTTKKILIASLLINIFSGYLLLKPTIKLGLNGYIVEKIKERDKLAFEQIKNDSVKYYDKIKERELSITKINEARKKELQSYNKKIKELEKLKSYDNYITYIDSIKTYNSFDSTGILKYLVKQDLIAKYLVNDTILLNNKIDSLNLNLVDKNAMYLDKQKEVDLLKFNSEIKDFQIDEANKSNKKLSNKVTFFKATTITAIAAGLFSSVYFGVVK